MSLPLWLYICSPWRMLIYAVLLFALDFGLVYGIMRLAKGIDDPLACTAKTVSWVYIANIVTQALGFAVMGIITATSSGETGRMLKDANYSTFSVFRIPLFAYLAGVVIMYSACRYVILKCINRDILERKVAAATIAFVTSPWIIMLPVVI